MLCDLALCAKHIVMLASEWTARTQDSEYWASDGAYSGATLLRRTSGVAAEPYFQLSSDGEVWGSRPLMIVWVIYV